jgi:hypothetical protein
MSAKALAKLLGRSPRSARRIWAQSRAEYERGSLTRLRPWEAEGISRATWYRRRSKRDRPLD